VKFGDGLSYSTDGANSGNVIAYNYIAAANTDSTAHWLSLSLNHGYHNWMNLLEGMSSTVTFKIDAIMAAVLIRFLFATNQRLHRSRQGDKVASGFLPVGPTPIPDWHIVW